MKDGVKHGLFRQIYSSDPEFRFYLGFYENGKPVGKWCLIESFDYSKKTCEDKSHPLEAKEMEEEEQPLNISR